MRSSDEHESIFTMCGELGGSREAGRMRLGVDAQRLAGQPLGVGRYIEYLVAHWGTMLNPTDSVTLYTRSPIDPARLKTSDAMELRQLRPRLTGLTWQTFVLGREAGALDVLFCPSYSMPMRYRGRCVVAIHSMNEVQPGTHPWYYRHTYSRVYRRSAHRADMVIVPAEATKRDLVRHYGITGDKIAIVPQGAPASFGPVDDKALLSETRKRFVGADRPYILFVGKLSHRRNIPILMAAFSKLKKERRIPHSLLLVGPNRQNLPLGALAADLGITESFIQTDGKISDHQELALVYNAADVFVLPSSYEGFSMTMVEALACGTPIVTVNRPALREVVDGCAVLIEELTPDALADALWQVIDDSDLQREMSAKGLDRSRRFRWDVCARQTLDVLRKVAES